MTAASDEMLVPGARRLRPDDHFMILSETDASPMHVGALLLFDMSGHSRDEFTAAIRRQFAERLPATPLLARLVEAPDGFDSDIWADVASVDMDRHVLEEAEPLDLAALRARIAALSTQRLDLSSAPFLAYAFPKVEIDKAALYLKMHHAVADGIGFQTVLRLLSDSSPPAAPRLADAALPDEESWRSLAEERFAALAPAAAAHKARRAEALAALEAMKDDPATRRPRTPELKMSGPTSAERAYATLSLPFDKVKAVAAALGGTINDLFLALASTAIRDALVALNDLPETPIVANSARSYRRADHGEFGNRIVALHPHIGTHLADPLDRLRAIQAQMRNEMARTTWDEAMLDQPEKPFGARDRRAKFAERTAGGGRLLPGNVTLSNVPGPSQELTYAGLPLLGNYPVPIIGSGRFMNITSRRNADRLDIGVMVDPTKLPDAVSVARSLESAMKLYAGLAGAS